MKKWKSKIGDAVLIIVGIAVSIMLLFDPPKLFNVIIDGITTIVVGVAVILYLIIFINHVRKTSNENNN